MQPAVLIRLHPAGPFRSGPSGSGPSKGSLNQVDALFRSDRLFSALTIAARQLGFLNEWLSATVHATAPAVAISSLYPFQADTLYVAPAATLWPPPPSQVTSPSPVFLTKIRWKAARFVPVQLMENIALGQKILADQWAPDPESGCLLRRDRVSTIPFRTVLRSGAPVDRLTQTSSSGYAAAAIEFSPGSGLWCALRFQDDAASQAWSGRLKGAFRLLADTGLGGRRSAGWGQLERIEFQDGTWPHVAFPRLARAAVKEAAAGESEAAGLFWMLSLFSPAESDIVDWAEGSYTVVERGAATGQRLRLIGEGSVVAARALPAGSAVNVAAEDAAHPVYRSGLALALKLPKWQEQIPEPGSVVLEESPETQELAAESPCAAPAVSTDPAVNIEEPAVNIAIAEETSALPARDLPPIEDPPEHQPESIEEPAPDTGAGLEQSIEAQEQPTTGTSDAAIDTAIDTAVDTPESESPHESPDAV